MAIIALLGAADAVSANAAMPPQNVPIELTLQSGQSSPPSIFPPIWNSTYDLPQGNGYNTWTANKQTPFPQGYQLTQSLNGQPGLWLWPIGSPAAGDKYPPGYAEYFFRAPGTTRIARASVDVSFRPALYNHHCTDIGLRSDTAVGTHFRDCSPPTPGSTTTDTFGPVHSRNVALFDPLTSPAAKEAFVRLEKPLCNGSNQLACLKYIPDNDATAGGSYLRAKKIAMTLVDDDLPVVTPSEGFYALDDTYIDGKQVYPLTVASSDAGAGIFASQFDHTLPTPPASLETLHEKAAACDPTHNSTTNESRICPASDSFSMTVDTNPFPEGTNIFRTWAVDPARNIGDKTWTVKVDRTPPDAPMSVATDFTYDPDAGLPDPATLIWQHNLDPMLADGTPGSGWTSDEVRWSLDGGPYTDWQANTSGSVVVDPDAYPDEAISLQIRSRDAVGNLSDVNTVVVILTAPVDADGIALSDRVENAQQFREDFGLTAHSVPTLEAMESNAAYEISQSEYGVALTPDEFAELDARVEREPEIASIQDAARSAYPGTFAGVSIDQENGGKLRIAFTSGAAVKAAQMTSGFSRPDLVEPVDADYSAQLLSDTYDDVSHDLEQIDSAFNTNVVSVSVNVDANRVDVAIRPFQSSVETQIVQAYGNHVRVIEGEEATPEASRTDFFLRTRAGLQIDSSSGVCTAGFSAVDQSADPDKYFVLTSGHCGDTSWDVANGGYELGNTTRMSYSDGKKADAQAISISHGRTSNAVFMPRYSRKTYRVETIADDEVKGEVICKSGRTTGVTCGKLVDREFTSTEDPDGQPKFKLYNQRRGSYKSKPGDSGAPVYRKVKPLKAVAVGIHSGRAETLTSNRAVYSHVQRIEGELNLLICLPARSDCGQ